MADAVYVSHNGITEPLGRSQVLPYLRGLAGHGHSIRLLAFEPPGSSTPPSIDPIEDKGITLHSLIRSPGTGLRSKILDLAAGTLVAAQMGQSGGARIFHGRGYLPTAVAAAALDQSPRSRKARLVFDIRGFLAEEYVDAGHWRPDELRFRVTKGFESYLLRRAHGIVVLTRRAAATVEELYSGMGLPCPLLKVIPCCVDMDRFTRDEEQGLLIRRRLGWDETAPVMVYSGSLGSWYMAREMALFFALARRHIFDLKLLLLTGSDPAELMPVFESHDVPESAYAVTRCAYHEMPSFLSAADLGISFIRPCFSKHASSPTKVAEYLACGLSVVVNRGVGDIDAQVEECPRLLAAQGQDLDLDGMEDLAERLDPDEIRSPKARAEARAFARLRFDLNEVGVARYHELYTRLAP